MNESSHNSTADKWSHAKRDSCLEDQWTLPYVRHGTCTTSNSNAKSFYPSSFAGPVVSVTPTP